MKTTTNAGIMPTAGMLREMFEYDPERGSLKWKPRTAVPSGGKKQQKQIENWNNRNAGKEVGHAMGMVNGQVGRRVRIGGVQIPVHVIAYAIMTGKMPRAARIVDGGDGTPWSNRWSNIEEYDPRDKTENDTWMSKGVYARPLRDGTTKYQALEKGNHVSIGLFDTFEEAKAAVAASPAPKPSAPPEPAILPSHIYRNATRKDGTCRYKAVLPKRLGYKRLKGSFATVEDAQEALRLAGVEEWGIKTLFMNHFVGEYRYHAIPWKDGKMIDAGTFDDLGDAIAARDKALAIPPGASSGETDDPAPETRGAPRERPGWSVNAPRPDEIAAGIRDFADELLAMAKAGDGFIAEGKRLRDELAERDRVIAGLRDEIDEKDRVIADIRKAVWGQ